MSAQHSVFSKTINDRNQHSSTVALLLISTATLCFEINLTRIFSVSQFYHFAFMIISIALLGFGASGTFLTLLKINPAKSHGKYDAYLASGSGLWMLISYLLINHLPFDSFRLALEPKQLIILFLHYLALAIPFFLNGMIISLMLSETGTAKGKIYAINLIGSSFGCIIVLLAPSLIGGEGMIALSAALSALSSLLFIPRAISSKQKLTHKSILRCILPTAVLIITLVIIGVRIISGNVPKAFQLNISPYKSISYALQSPQAKQISRQWNSYSMVDVVESPSLHSVPGLSYRYLQPLPTIQGLFIDGDNLNAIMTANADLNFVEYLPSAIAYQFHPGAEVLLLEPIGGMEVLAASALKADHIIVTQGNPLVIQAADWIYQREDVQLIKSSGRSYLRGSQNNFDVIQIPLTDSYHPVSSGAYALGEDYRYTVESFTDMIKRLNPDGILVVTRWLQEEPSEWFRIFTLAVTALEDQNLDPAKNIIAFRGYNTGTLLIKPSPFTSSELASIRKFLDEKAFDLVQAPGITPNEVNRYNILPEPIYYQSFSAFLNSVNKNAYYDAYKYNITPPTDNHPFFGHYFKWSQLTEIINRFGLTWQPFGGAGYLVIIFIFLLALVLSGLLILLPVGVVRKGEGNRKNRSKLVYFGLIGFAFMFVEMPLIQRFILYLDQPAYALATILFCILLFSGLGSRFGSHKIKPSLALALLSLFLIIYLLALPELLHLSLGLHLIIRILLTIILIAPIGFMMGIPSPAGLNWIINNETEISQNGSQRLISWVWAVNGACSVMASISASLIALSFGFSATFTLGVICYLLAGVLIRKQPKQFT